MAQRYRIVWFLLLLAGLIFAGLLYLKHQRVALAEKKGLALHFDFSEGEGDTLKDRSGNGNDGIIHGAKWQKEKDGYSLCFDGVDDYVEVKDAPSLSIKEEFTLEVLVKPGENPKKEGFGALRLLVGKDGEYWNPESSFGLYLYEGCGCFTGYARYGIRNTTNENDVYTASCPVKEPHTWHKMSLVKTKYTLRIFVDSMLWAQVSTPENMIASGRPLRIGGIAGRFFKGDIKEVKLFNCAREIKTIKTWRPRKKRRLPYLVMVTSMDEQISSTPLLDVKEETIKLFNNSPFDGIAFNLVDIYSGQPLPDKSIVVKKAEELKRVSTKLIWVRVNMNRMYQRSTNSVYYREGFTRDGLAYLGKEALTVEEIRRRSTPYFASIKGMDIYDEAGALSDFYRIWELALVFSRRMRSGICLDLEDYGHTDIYPVLNIAKAQDKPVEDVIRRIREIGAEMADIAAKTYPEAPVIGLFTQLKDIKQEGGKSIAYICEGMLMRAKEKKIPLKLIEGGEGEVGYVNRTIDKLKAIISQRWYLYRPWLERFPSNFFLGGTITLWDDPSKVSGWTKDYAGEPNPFKSLQDFKPFLKELFSNYDYIWFYQPMCIDYKPYDPNIAPAFHQKLKGVINEIYKEMNNDI